MKITSDLRELKEIYLRGKVVPFVGAGLSKPFNIPNWKELLKELSDQLIDADGIKDIIVDAIEADKYWDAIDLIKDYSIKDDNYINMKVIHIINSLKSKDKTNIDNNYKELNKLKVPYYLTTNYDNLLNYYIDGDYQATILSNLESGTQLLALNDSGKRIFHLHGDLANSGSIVLSKKSYEDLYSSEKYKELFNFFKSGYTFLFIGFSFSDKYIVDLMLENIEIFKTYHYILLPNPDTKIKKEYMDKYKLIVIGYEVDDMSDNRQHIEGIRKILQLIGAKGEENKNF